MTRYVALLRGIGPTNPNMRGEKLRECFESLGFKNVHTVIASGNVIFDAKTSGAGALEKKIEAALPQKLGFSSMTIVLDEAEVRKLQKQNPFKGNKRHDSMYTVVTLRKEPLKTLGKFRKSGSGFVMVGIDARAVASSVDTKNNEMTKFMGFLEKEFGKDITTRTWKTVDRILDKFDKTALN